VTAASQGPAVATGRAHLDLALVILAIQKPPGIERCLASLGVCIFDQGWQRTAAWTCQLGKLGYAQNVEYSRN
jgi:hypothetical protein